VENEFWVDSIVQSYLREAIISQYATNIPMLDNQPSKTPIPQLHLGDRIICSEAGILERRHGCLGASERKLGRSCTTTQSCFPDRLKE
jgi:hypothetical protein